jgi:hypothetical protein
VPGKTDKVAQERRELYPKIKKLRAARVKSVTDAVRHLAEEMNLDHMSA